MVVAISASAEGIYTRLWCLGSLIWLAVGTLTYSGF